MNIGSLVDQGFAEIRTGPFGTQLRASDYVTAGRPVLNVRNVGFGNVRAKDLEYVDEATAERLSGHLLTVNDIVFGRKGAVERHAFIGHDFDGAMQGSDCIRLRISDDSPIPAAFLTFALRTEQHQTWMKAFCSHGSTMASLNQDIVRKIPLPEIGQAKQRLAIEILQTFDDLIENNRRRVETLETMLRSIYTEWFVKFRYPGHADVPLIDSAIGLIPKAWELHSVASVASKERNAVSSGPFGSKLGRRDYVASGVPVIRGGNLRVGGGFDEADFVYITASKAEELRSAWARRGDVIVTQRGTLGQVGRIPAASRFDLYVLSQSQMKVTIDEQEVDPVFFYAQLCSDLATQRFVARGMAAGVPHVNLRLLREFLLLVPPRGLQSRFSEAAAPLLEQAFGLELEQSRLADIRDMFLPKLVRGELAVSALDLEAVLESAVA